MDKGKIVAGIPSNRPELCKKAVAAWRETKEFDEIWVMWDRQDGADMNGWCVAERNFFHSPEEVGRITCTQGVFVPACIPHHSSCCRSRLVWEAWVRKDVEWLVHLDDDVVPSKPSESSWRDCINVLCSSSTWFNTMQDLSEFPRGHPYGIRKRINSPKVVHGVWRGIPDFDAISQLKWLEESYYCNYSQDVVPRGQYFPMSSMAVAIHRDLFPASYFLWMGKDLPLNKFGDIWCGVILKKICDYFGWLVTSGAPVVYHERASNVWENLRQECKCIEENENWWKWVDGVDISSCLTVQQAYRQIATQMEMPKEPRFKELRKKMLQWISMFQK